MDIIKKLPDDIKTVSLPFTYNIQPKALLEDIRHFHHSFPRLTFKLPYFAAGCPYYNTWDCIYYGLFIENPTLLDTCSILKRSAMITDEKLPQFVMTATTKTIAKLYWALLTIEEREIYLQTRKPGLFVNTFE